MLQITIWLSARKMVVETFSSVLDILNEPFHNILQFSELTTACIRSIRMKASEFLVFLQFHSSFDEVIFFYSNYESRLYF